jgi:hypothetical protein
LWSKRVKSFEKSKISCRDMQVELEGEVAVHRLFPDPITSNIHALFEDLGSPKIGFSNLADALLF